MRYLLVGLLLGMTGCATSQSLVGHTSQDLIASKGLPDQQMTTDQGKIYQYKRCRTYGDEDLVTSSCHRTTYYLENDKVVRVERKKD